jgi:hypothetical protein
MSDTNTFYELTSEADGTEATNDFPLYHTVEEKIKYIEFLAATIKERTKDIHILKDSIAHFENKLECTRYHNGHIVKRYISNGLDLAAEHRQSTIQQYVNTIEVVEESLSNLRNELTNQKQLRHNTRKLMNKYLKANFTLIQRCYHMRRLNEPKLY